MDVQVRVLSPVPVSFFRRIRFRHSRIGGEHADKRQRVWNRNGWAPALGRAPLRRA